MNRNTLVYALGTILLGAVGIWFHEFAMQWQPVPKGIAMHTPLAYLSGVLLIIGGGAILTRGGERIGALLLTVFYGFWVVALHLPLSFASYKHIGAWNAPAELTLATMGGLALFASTTGSLRTTLALAARVLAGVCGVVFGFAHFNYADFTASMVPSWIPYPLFWAYATGAGHLAAGVALISGIQARLAATLWAAMMGSFAVLLHVPRVIATPDQHVEWIMLAVSTTFAGAALNIRKYAT